jgi:hypothetical protein
VFGLDQFWFLPALFLIFLVTVVLERYGCMGTQGRWLATLAAVSVFQLVVPSPQQVLGYRGAVYLLPYFVLGIGLCRFSGLFARFVIPISLAFMGGMLVHQLALFGYVDLELAHPLTPLALLVGLSGIVFLFQIRRPVPVLAWLGFYAYGIYLFHVFPTAGTRILLQKLGVTSFGLVFVVALAMGLLMPIAIELVIVKRPVMRRLLLGLRRAPGARGVASAGA